MSFIIEFVDRPVFFACRKKWQGGREIRVIDEIKNSACLGLTGEKFLQMH
jgi:hypothetical protein